MTHGSIVLVEGKNKIKMHTTHDGFLGDVLEMILNLLRFIKKWGELGFPRFKHLLYFFNNFDTNRDKKTFLLYNRNVPIIEMDIFNLSTLICTSNPCFYFTISESDIEKSLYEYWDMYIEV